MAVISTSKQMEKGIHGEKVSAILDHLYPETSCFLHYSTPYTLLIAVLLSAQSTDIAVNKVMPHLINKADTPEKMLAIGLEWLQMHIKTIGLHHRKSIYIMALSTALIENHRGRVPSDIAALIALPGVGRKTALVILNVLFNQPTIPVDTHIFRVARRLGLAVGNTPEKVERDLESTLPDAFKKKAHTKIILHGRTLCKARTPLCHACPLAHLCPHFKHHVDLKP